MIRVLPDQKKSLKGQARSRGGVDEMVVGDFNQAELRTRSGERSQEHDIFSHPEGTTVSAAAVVGTQERPELAILSTCSKADFPSLCIGGVSVEAVRWVVSGLLFSAGTTLFD